MAALAAATIATDTIEHEKRLGMMISLEKNKRQPRQTPTSLVFSRTRRTSVGLKVSAPPKTDVGDAQLSPAAGISVADNRQDSDTSRWQLATSVYTNFCGAQEAPRLS
jgi:hypothetical protein